MPQKLLNPQYALSHVDLQGDSLQKGVVSQPTILSAWDSPGYATQSFMAPDVASQDPKGSPVEQGDGIVDQINKGVGAAIGMPQGVLTSGIDSWWRDTVVAAIGITFLAVGLYAITK